MPGMPGSEVSVTQGRLDQLLEAEITVMALRESRSLTLKSIMESTGDLCEMASLLHEELPVRYAHRIKMLESLPRWHEKKSITHVRQMYVTSFKELRLADPRQPEDFRKQLENIKNRHCQTNLLVGGFKKYAEMEEMGEKEINDWLDRFFVLRVSTNMLISQYLEIVRGPRSIDDNAINPYQSSINPVCDPTLIARHAAQVIGQLCKQWYGSAPEIRVSEVGDRAGFGVEPFPFVPRYFFYILSELLKNSVRATVENHQQGRMAPVDVLVSSGERVLSVRISDEGGGIPVDRLSHVWSYLYTTAEPLEAPLTRAGVDAPTDLRRLEMSQSIYDSTGRSMAHGNEEQMVLRASPLAGLGCGLPLSRLYAQYLGGEVKLHSLPNFGTDVFVYLNRLGTSNEGLPEM